MEVAGAFLYVLALRSLFAYEPLDDRTLVVAAGLAPEWTSGAGVEMRKMPALYGALTFSARTLDAHTFRCDIAPGVAARFELRPPLPGRLLGVSVNGSDHADFHAQSVAIGTTPAQIICHSTASA